MNSLAELACLSKKTAAAFNNYLRVKLSKKFINSVFFQADTRYRNPMAPLVSLNTHPTNITVSMLSSRKSDTLTIPKFTPSITVAAMMADMVASTITDTVMQPAITICISTMDMADMATDSIKIVHCAAIR